MPCAPFAAADARAPARPRAPQARPRRQWRARPRSGAPTEQRDACLEAVAARLGQPFAEGGRAIIVRTAAAAPGEPLPGAVPRCAALHCSALLLTRRLHMPYVLALAASARHI
jgi:hypothetical protein